VIGRRRDSTQTHRCFTAAEDERIQRIMHGRADVWEPREWEIIAALIGGGLTARQVMDRWHHYLRPGLSRTEFTVAERRECLRRSMLMPGEWTSIATMVGDGRSRSSVQIKSVVNLMYVKLEKLHIAMYHPDAVESLPVSFFDRGTDQEEMNRIRSEYIVSRIATLRRQLAVGNTDEVDESNSR
jgi:hypothetical protein